MQHGKDIAGVVVSTPIGRLARVVAHHASRYIYTVNTETQELSLAGKYTGHPVTGNNNYMYTPMVPNVFHPIALFLYIICDQP